MQDKMTISKVLATLVVILIGMTFATDWLITSAENQDFRDRYNTVEPGMTESTVVSLLGTPNKQSSEFRLDKKEGFEEAYKRVAGSGATRYLMWHREADAIYTVGIDKNGKVVVTEAGGT